MSKALQRNATIVKDTGANPRHMQEIAAISKDTQRYSEKPQRSPGHLICFGKVGNIQAPLGPKVIFLM
jgi:hypothetical protein